MDNRDSSPILAQAITDGVMKLKGITINVGHITTPQLHELVVDYNKNKTLHVNFEKYKNNVEIFQNITKISSKPILYIDSSNGVGSDTVIYLKDCLKDYFEFIPLNCNGVINQNCGAEHVHKEKSFPTGLPNKIHNKRFAALDGDADRSVYFYKDFHGNKIVLDGDKMATLIALFLKEELTKVFVNRKINVIHTGYSNGAMVKYLEEQEINTICVETGIKNLHNEAIKHDVSVYFESNGHGSIHFSPSILLELEVLSFNNAKLILAFYNLFNQYVGDAIGNIIAIELILKRKKLMLEEWNNLYKNYPYIQDKITIKDKDKIKSFQVPSSEFFQEGTVQNELNVLIKNYPDTRCFVRPSGTENYLRIYVEGKINNVIKINENVKLIIQTMLT